MHPDVTALGAVTRTVVACLLIVAAVQFMLMPTLVEHFRQRLFAIRRSLFLVVADERLRPDAPAHVQLRSTINGLLRFAERTTFMRVALSNAIGREPARDYEERTKKNLAAIEDRKVRQEIIDRRGDVEFAIVRHVIFITPWLWPVILGLIVWAMGLRAAKTWLRRFSPSGFEAEAEISFDRTATACRHSGDLDGPEAVASRGTRSTCARNSTEIMRA